MIQLPPDGRDERLLLVEDNPADVDLVAAHFEDAGQEVPAMDVVETVGRAVELLGGTEYQAILLDLNLPDSSGLDTLRRILLTGSSAPVIVLTGAAGGELGVEALSMGAIDYLPKDELTGSLLRRSIRYGVERARSARRLKRTLEALEDAVLAVEASSRTIVDCNSAAESMFGYRAAELVGRSVRMIHVDDESFRRLQTEGYSRLGKGGSYHTELLLRRKDGSTFPAEVTLTLLRPEMGLDGGAIGVVRDITERVESDRRIRFQAALLQEVGQPVLAVDEAGNVTYWNPAAEELTGWSASEALGRPALDLIVPPEDRRAVLAARAAVRAGGLWEGEIQIRKKDGETVVVRTTVRSAHNPDGTPGGRIAAGVDVTELRRAEEASREAAERLRHAEKMEAVGRLAGGVAHDFNNLLTVVEGHASLLLESLDEDSDLRESAQEIRVAGRRAASLTGQLLAFSRKQVLEERNVDLGRTVSELSAMLRRLVPERIELWVEADPGDVVVRADETQLQQVVMNLVVNAVDAIPDGGVIKVGLQPVELTEPNLDDRQREVKPGSYARLSVSDTGEGIVPSALEHIFEPFFTTKPEGVGTGLGLATVYGIVKQSGGHVFVDSAPGRGTTFTVLLPRVSELADETPEQVSVEPVEGGAVILLVEDEDAVRRIASRVLSRAGFTVLESSNGREALEVGAKDAASIDLVISDVIMPDMGGVELWERLSSVHPHVDWILMSGYSEAEVQEEIRSLGTAFLAKPFVPDDLIRCVSETLARRRA